MDLCGLEMKKIQISGQKLHCYNAKCRFLIHESYDFEA